jgi:hypothetical protein
MDKISTYQEILTVLLFHSLSDYAKVKKTVKENQAHRLLKI